MQDNLKLCAKWTNDCQGKKDYDGDIVSISTRYWPRGGGFWHLLVDENGAREFPQDMTVAPSATSSLLLRYGRPGWYESIRITEKSFEGETFEEIAPQVEKWAQEQMDRVVTALMNEFNGNSQGE